MDSTQILIIILLVIVGVIVFKIVKNLLKALVTISALLTIAVVVAGILVYLDAKEFKENAGSNLVLLKENSKALAGVITKEGESKAIVNLDDYSERLRNKDYNLILGESYKLIIIDIKAVEELGRNSFEVDGEELGKNFALQVLRSDNAVKLLPKYSSSEEAKAAVLASVFKDIMKPTNFFSQYKKGNIIVYPETAMFKAIKLIPFGVIKSIAGKALTIVRVGK